IDDLLELTEGDVEQIAHGTGQGLEEPDMRHGNGEFYMPHPFPPHLTERHFDAAAVADHAAITNSLVLAAMAFPVLDGTEDALAEEAVLLGLEGAVVDGLGLGDFAPAPPAPQALQLEALALFWIFGTADLLG